ncbi:MAG: hypothetical protein Q4G07_06555, partial [Oscillospiraceae bacterium]|nr:hypothetical protein [Oscillospiraceae bacterium]
GLESKEFINYVLLGYCLNYEILDERKKAREYIQKLEDNKNKTGMKQYDRDIEGYSLDRLTEIQMNLMRDCCLC